jgi:hypothetical protein
MYEPLLIWQYAYRRQSLRVFGVKVSLVKTRAWREFRSVDRSTKPRSNYEIAPTSAPLSSQPKFVPASVTRAQRNRVNDATDFMVHTLDRCRSTARRCRSGSGV